MTYPPMDGDAKPESQAPESQAPASQAPESSTPGSPADSAPAASTAPASTPPASNASEMPKLPEPNAATLHQPAHGPAGGRHTSPARDDTAFKPTSYSSQPSQSSPRSQPSQSSFRPGGYAGQSHAQYGQPSPSQAGSNQSTSGYSGFQPSRYQASQQQPGQHQASQSQPGQPAASAAFGRPQPYGTPASTSHYGMQSGAHAGMQPAAPQSSSPQSAAASRRDKKRGRGARATVVMLSLLLPIGIAAGAIAGYTYANQLGSYNPQSVEREVVAVLRDDYGLSDLAEVDCPDWIKVEQGESFQCEFEYAGGTQTVTVTQGSQSGQLVIGAPE